MSTTIAQTILTQLGGNRFLAMTGAKQLCDLGDGIMFNLPRGAKNKANKVAIRLAGDLYTVKFYSLRGVNVTERGEFEMIYGDRLAALPGAALQIAARAEFDGRYEWRVEKA